MTRWIILKIKSRCRTVTDKLKIDYTDSEMRKVLYNMLKVKWTNIPINVKCNCQTTFIWHEYIKFTAFISFYFFSRLYQHNNFTKFNGYFGKRMNLDESLQKLCKKYFCWGNKSLNAFHSCQDVFIDFHNVKLNSSSVNSLSIHMKIIWKKNEWRQMENKDSSFLNINFINFHDFHSKFGTQNKISDSNLLGFILTETLTFCLHLHFRHLHGFFLIILSEPKEKDFFLIRVHFGNYKKMSNLPELDLVPKKIFFSACGFILSSFYYALK